MRGKRVKNLYGGDTRHTKSMPDNDQEAVQPQDENAEVEATTTETEVENPDEGQETEVTEQAPETQEEAKPIKREVYSMPVAKAQEEKRKAVERARKEAEEASKMEIERIKQDYEAKLKSAAPTSEDDLLRTVAEKHGLDPDATRELADAIRSGIKLPDTSKYDKILKEREIEGHKQVVSKEFDEKVAPLILKDHPQATPEFIREVKGRIQEMAFTEGYNTYRLEDIYKVRRDDFTFKNGMSAEAPKGHGTDISPFRRLSDEDEIKLADTDMDAYKRYIDWLRGQESKFSS